MNKEKKLLVVEDDDLMRTFFKDHLSLIGYDVETLSDGIDVLQSYSPGRYDAILMDTQMNHSLGYEICAQLRKQDSKVIIIGMSVDRGCRQQWIDAGANDFIPKSVQLIRSLESRLSQYLNRN